MIVKTPEESIKNLTDYAKELMKLQLHKKSIDADIKELKQHWKEEGVAVSKVTKVLNRIKSKQKMSETDLSEEELIQEYLERDNEITDNILELNA